MGWPNALSPPSGLTGQISLAVEGCGQHVLPSLTALREPEVFHQNQLRGREAIMHLSHGEFFTRIMNAGLLEYASRADATTSGKVVKS